MKIRWLDTLAMLGFCVATVMFIAAMFYGYSL